MFWHNFKMIKKNCPDKNNRGHVNVAVGLPPLGDQPGLAIDMESAESAQVLMVTGRSPFAGSMHAEGHGHCCMMSRDDRDSQPQSFGPGTPSRAELLSRCDRDNDIPRELRGTGWREDIPEGRAGTARPSPPARLPESHPLIQWTSHTERILDQELRQALTCVMQHEQRARGVAVLDPCSWCGQPTSNECGLCSGPRSLVFVWSVKLR